MASVRLLHTSDIHLGNGGFATPAEGTHQPDCMCPLLAIEAAVQRESVDAVLVVGDLFEHQRVSSDLVASVLDRLGRLGVPCVLTVGNHDVHDESSLYPSDAVAASNVLFLGEPAGGIVELLAGNLQVWSKAMPAHDRNFRPLQDVPDRPDSDAWWVILGHGHFEAAPDEKFGRSSPITSAEIEATAADYVALGHWHRRTDLSTDSVTAWYSGAPYGFGASELLNVVDLCPESGVTVTGVEATLPPGGCLGQ